MKIKTYGRGMRFFCIAPVAVSAITFVGIASVQADSRFFDNRFQTNLHVIASGVQAQLPGEPVVKLFFKLPAHPLDSQSV